MDPQTAHGTYDSTADTTSHPDDYPPSTLSGYPDAPQMPRYPAQASSTRMPMVGTANYRPHPSSVDPDYSSLGNNIGSSYTPFTQEELELLGSQPLSESGRTQQDDPLNFDGQWT